MDLTLTPARTAFVVIDLQRGIVGAPTAPHPAGDVVAHAAAVAVALRAAGGTVVLALSPAVSAPPHVFEQSSRRILGRLRSRVARAYRCRWHYGSGRTALEAGQPPEQLSLIRTSMPAACRGASRTGRRTARSRWRIWIRRPGGGAPWRCKARPSDRGLPLIRISSVSSSSSRWSSY